MPKHKQNKKPKPNRKHKDTVFVDLFARDETAEQNFRSLYNAISQYPLSENAKLEPLVVENVLYTNMVNDVSYLVDGSEIFLVEHQSTVNENMSMRFYLYLARLFCYLLESEDLYQKGYVKTPTPEFYVFYNGREDYPLEKTLEISTGFKKRKKKFKLELTVEVININPHKGHEVLQKCKPLREYSLFVEAVRKHTEPDP